MNLLIEWIVDNARDLSAALLFLLFYPSLKEKIRYHAWKKSLHLQQHERIFQDIYQEVNGFALSKQARQQQDACEYVYGEIELLPFIALLSLAKPDEHTVFYDLGAGVGKAVLACAMVYPVARCTGIELFPELYQCALQQKKRLAQHERYTHQAQKIDFILGDFLSVNLSEATYLFINASALFGESWHKLCAIINQLPHVRTVISTSKPLISNILVPTISTQIQMSWGVATAYIHTVKPAS